MQDLEDFIYYHEHPKIQSLLIATHELIITLVPQVKPMMKWKIPFYVYFKNLCYLNPVKDHIELGFPFGVFLSNTQGLLEAGNRKQVRVISIYTLEDLEQTAISEIILEAALYNKEQKRR